MTSRELLHHPFGPSTLPRRLRCPGSYAEEAGIGDLLPPVVSKAAEEGTLLHAATAEQLAGGFLQVKTDDAQQELVLRAVKWVSRIAAENSINWTPDIEKRVEVKGEHPERPLYFGTADVVWIHKKLKTCVVLDHKFGYVPLDEAEAAIQVAAYIVAVCEEHNLESGKGFLYMPRLGIRKEVEVNEPKKFLDRIREIIGDSKAPNAPRKVGKWCRHCTALDVCPESVAHAHEFERQVSTIENVETLPVERLRPLADMLLPIEAAAKAVRARMRACLEIDPNCLPGWELQETNGQRAADLMPLYRVVKDLAPRLDYADFLHYGCKVSVPQVQKLCAKEGIDEATFKERTGDVVNQPKIKKLRRVK